MRSSRTTSVEELQVVNRFKSLRTVLLSDPYAGCLDHPLAYWALPSDRRLPLALLGRTLRDLLNTPFAELAATPGIGQKKIRTLIMLLSRVTNTEPSEVQTDFHSAEGNGEQAGPRQRERDGFDPGSVSEVLWDRWRASVLHHGLGTETLGRFAPSLRNMTRVIWSSPLSAYTCLTLTDIRAMKTHGQKRVHAILEVFYCLHHLLEGVGEQPHLVLRIAPRRIDAVETWVGRMLQTPGAPGCEEVFHNFVQPLLEQTQVDAAAQITRLAENRLGLHGRITSVRQAARDMNLTRARVYQLLNEINDIMAVRWPMGRHQVYELRARLQAEAAQMDDPPDLEQFHAAVELFYPGSRRGAAGPLETTTHAFGEDRETSENGEGQPALEAELVEVGR